MHASTLEKKDTFDKGAMAQAAVQELAAAEEAAAEEAAAEGLALDAMLVTIVSTPELHLRWLATLSHLENCGARKIVAYQPTFDVPLQVLQHAAEETRHAFFFRKLMSKLPSEASSQVAPLLGGALGRRYLHLLDLKVSRYLRSVFGLSGRKLKWASYLLTTFAIETRADDLYPRYERVLKQTKHRFSIQGLINEEENHLQQITADLSEEASLEPAVAWILALEKELFACFRAALAEDVRGYPRHP